MDKRADEVRGAEHEVETLDELVEVIPAESFERLEAGALLKNPATLNTYQVARSVTYRDWSPSYQIYEVSLELTDDLSAEEQTAWIWHGISQNSIADLQREVEFWKKLGSEFVPQILEEFESDESYIVVTNALVDQNLADSMAQKSCTMPEFLDVLIQVASSLSRLHDQGFLHLGVRPQCVVMTDPVTLLDFKWAIEIGGTPSQSFSHPGYSIPELGRKEQIDIQADIFSVCAVLFHFLKGHPVKETGVTPTELVVPYSGIPQILSGGLGVSEKHRFASMNELKQALLSLQRIYSPVLKFQVAGGTTIGLNPDRITNQDAYGYIQTEVEFEGERVHQLFACVADGMGGMEAGDVASMVAVRSVLSQAGEFLKNSPPHLQEEHVNMIVEWVQKANSDVCSALDDLKAQGGTTLLCALLIGRYVTIAHVGDCRLYLLRNDEYQFLTRDHSVATLQMLMNNEVDLVGLRNHPDRNTLYRSLGSEQELKDSWVDTLKVMAGSSILEVKDGDVLLLCSDGLWEPVIESEMTKIAGSQDLQNAVSQLLQKALEGGAPDNATVVLIKCQEMRVSGFELGDAILARQED